MNPNNAMIKPAILSGAILGFLAALPGLNLVNCCTCCSFAIGAGFLASYLHSRDCDKLGVAFDAGRGAGAGALAGVIWGLTTVSVSTVINLAFGDQMLEWLIPLVEQNASMPPEILDALEEAREQGITMASWVLDAVVTVGLGAIFATLGGLLGGAVFKSEEKPPAPASPPPTPPLPPVE